MSIQIRLQINNIKKSISLEKDLLLSDLIAQVVPNEYHYSSSLLFPNPFWVLVDLEHMYSAYETSASRLNDGNIITFSFAHSQPVFQYILETLLEQGIQLDGMNTPLHVFTIMTWYTKKEKKTLSDAFDLTRLYPDFFTQPFAFFQVYEKLRKEEYIRIPNHADSLPYMQREEVGDDI